MTPRLRQAIPFARIVPWALLIAALTATYVFGRSDAASDAIREQKLKTADSLLVISRAEGRRVDTLHLRDTVTLRRIETRTVTLLDTLLHSDTVVLTKRESVLVFMTDSLVRACRTAIGSCEQTAMNLREQLSLTTRQRDLYRRKAEPSLWQQLQQLPGRAVSTAAIASLGYAACKLGGL